MAAAIVILLLALILRDRSVYLDLGSEGTVLISYRYSISGKPDAIRKKGRSYIPVELKSVLCRGEAREWDVAQVLAYCLIIEDVIGPVSHGEIIYANGIFSVPWDERNRAYILEIISRMRNGENRMTLETWKCIHCPYRVDCGR